MKRIAGDQALPAQPARDPAGPVFGWFGKGDPATGVQATEITKEWLNDVQEEIVAVIVGAGIALSTAQNQLLNAIGTLIASAITALHLGTASTHAATDFDSAGSATAAQNASLQKTSNLSDVSSAGTARTNLGLGSAATHAAGDFDAAGAASAAQSAAIAASLQKSANLSDLASVATAKSNLGMAKRVLNLGAPTSSSNPSAAHTLGVQPDFWSAYIQCTTAEHGYTVGQSVAVGGGGTSRNDGGTSWADGTNVGVSIGANGLWVTNPSNASGELINAAHWTLFAVAIVH